MKVIGFLDKTLKYIAILALVMMVFVVFFNAILRYFFDSGIAWSEEFARVCFVYMVFLGIILVARENGHLKVDILISNLPPQIKLIFRILSDLLILLAMVVISYGAILLIELTYNQKMPAMEISSSLIYLPALISAVSYLFIVFLDICKQFKFKNSGD